MARTHKTLLEKNPQDFEVLGVVPTKGETIAWLGTVNGTSNGCSTCDVPHDVKIYEIDPNSTTEAFYIESTTRNNCCGNVWTAAQDFTRDVSTAPIEAQMAAQTADLVKEMTLPYHSIIKRTREVADMLLRQHFAQQGSAVLTGVCSGCYGDVKILGGKVVHNDAASTCAKTPAILL